MKNTFYFTAILSAVVGFGAMCSKTETPIQAQELAVQHCVVSDSSGTPLNVRSTPNGKKIVGKLKNATKVAFEIEEGDGQDRGWANIWLDTKRDKKGKPLGWVLRESLECE